ncbi:ataxin-7-like protein 1 [Anguilla rostrata]|uniref:ataxin-7-like protein 1 n=1 Tax=Anguilla rostrata TaxID=7938 RepID=UPI0030CB0CCC
MATLDRKVPSPNTFLYKPWSAFIEAVKLQNSDIAHVEDTGKDIGNGRDARKLNREDMHLYGQYPAYDELCLVVCNICSQVVKPQGFLSHYERRHAPSCDSRPPLTQRPKVSHSSPPQPRPFRPPRDNQHTPFSRAPHTVYPPKGARTKPCVSVPVVSLEKMSCLGRVEGPHVRISYPSSSSSSSSSPAASVRPPHKPQERVLNGRGPSAPSPSPSTLDKRPSPSPSPTALDRRPTPSPSSSLDRPSTAPPPLLDRKHQNGTKGTKPYKRVSGRVFDPNKHCGVLDPESKKPCTRSLTCKTHSLTHRRAVPGRGKQFDSLLAEHKGRHLREQQGSHAHPSRPAQSHEPTSSTSTDCQDGRTTSLLKSRLATAHIPRPPGGWSSVGPPPDSAPPCPAAGGGDRLSGEEGEGETPEDLDCPYSSHHPRPMACCAFGSRLMGRGCFVFERRWDRVRVALRCMVEKHVNAQMWRKIPLAAESRTPYPGSQPAPHPLAPPGSASLPPPLLPSPALASPTNSVSMVTYSTAFPHVGGGGGVFSIVDSASLLPPVPALAPLFPSQSRAPRSRPSKPPKACEPLSRGGGGAAGGTTGGGGALGGTTGGGGAVGGVTGSKKRKSPLSSSSSSYTGPPRGNFHSATPPPNSHQSSPTLSSNGTSPLCAKTPPPGPGLPRPLPFSGDHALFARADGRKRKSSSPVGRPGKTPKPAALSSLYRPPGPEPHPALPRQPKVHH